MAFRSTITMEHTGDFQGVVGNGAKLSVVEMGFMRMKDGKIIEMWALLDSFSLMKQMGMQ